MKTLTLSLNASGFDMIKAGVKKEEYSDVPHNVEKIHRICDTCMMPIEVKNPWNEKETKK